ncbi:MAG: MBL fold metallo-hydrolase, partial [Chloroflexota bacterium]
MTVDIRVLTLGPIETNCYLVGDTETGQAVVIDPVDDADQILATTREAGWTISLILATHAHFDHVLASKPLKQATGAPFIVHEDSIPLLKNVPQMGMMFLGRLLPRPAEPDRLLTSEPESIDIGAIHLETRFTPGHAPGHVSFYMPQQKLVFSGDALFAGSIGRTDLPGGDLDLLMRSIDEQLLTLPDDTRVLPGHGGVTT